MRFRTSPSPLLAATLLALTAPACAEEAEAPPVAAPSARRVVMVEAPLPVAAPVVVQPAQIAHPAPEAVIVTPPPAIPPTAPPSSATPPGLETWQSRNGEAAKTLGAWVHDNPEAAKRLFEFDASKPEHTRELVTWAIHHPGADIMTLVNLHPDWPWFDKVTATHRVGMNQFLQWTRSHPAAAEELTNHPSGLRWVGDHIYSTEWHG